MLSDVTLYGKVWSAEKDGKKIEWKFKHEDKLILFKATDKDPELLEPLIEAAKEGGYSLVDVEEINKKLEEVEGEQTVLCWNYAHEEYVPIVVILHKEVTEG